MRDVLHGSYCVHCRRATRYRVLRTGQDPHRECIRCGRDPYDRHTKPEREDAVRRKDAEPLDMFGDSANAPYQRGSATSAAGARSVSPETLGAQKARIVAAIEQHGPLTRQALAERLHLPLASVCGRVRDLVVAGWLAEDGAEEGPYHTPRALLVSGPACARGRAA